MNGEPFDKVCQDVIELVISVYSTREKFKKEIDGECKCTGFTIKVDMQ